MIESDHGIASLDTHPFPTLLDDVQRELGEGPCLSAAWNKTVISIDDLHTEPPLAAIPGCRDAPDPGALGRLVPVVAVVAGRSDCGAWPAIRSGLKRGPGMSGEPANPGPRNRVGTKPGVAHKRQSPV